MKFSKNVNPDILLSADTHFFYVYQNYLNQGKYLNPIWISPYGSMNYGTFNPNKSDVDTKLIVLPAYDTLIWDKPFIKEYKIPNGELCTTMDIRHFTNNLFKQSIGFLETLFSDYEQTVNMNFFSLWNTYFISNNELIAHYNEKECIHAACYQALHILHQNIEEDGKKYANVLRLIDFINKYSQGYPFKECIIVSKNLLDEILTFKNGIEFPNLKKINLLQAHLNSILEIDDKKFQSHPEVKEILCEGTEKLIKKNLELTK